MHFVTSLHGRVNRNNSGMVTKKDVVQCSCSVRWRGGAAAMATEVLGFFFSLFSRNLMFFFCADFISGFVVVVQCEFVCVFLVAWGGGGRGDGGCASLSSGMLVYVYRFCCMVVIVIIGVIFSSFVRYVSVISNNVFIIFFSPAVLAIMCL